LNKTNYNFLAPFYKTLSRIVFGKGLEESSAHYFYKIKEGEKVLIIGGGNGEVLKGLYDSSPRAIVSYCELSSKFIGLANKKNPFPREQIVFLEKDAFDLENFKYHWIVLPFFLDQFKEEECIRILTKMHGESLVHTKILFSDMDGKGCPKWLLSFMFLFFRITTGLKRTSLPGFNKVFQESGWEKQEEGGFSNGKVVSRVYGK